MKKLYLIFAALLAVACTQQTVTVIPDPVDRVTDKQYFSPRGSLLDVVRHFYTVDR